MMNNIYDILEHYYTTHSRMFLIANMGKLQPLTKMYKVGDITGAYKWTNSKKLGWFNKAEHDRDTIIYKGRTTTDSGYFYCPYVPSFKVSKAK